MRTRERKSSLGEAMRTMREIREEEEKAAVPGKGKIGHITIRAALADRMYWQSRAKRDGTTITKVILKFLTELYGAAPVE
jgi:hypothetical protein